MAGNRFANLPATAARLLGMNAGSDNGVEPENTEAVEGGEGDNAQAEPAGNEPAAEAAMNEVEVQAIIDATKAQEADAWTAKIAAVFGHENAKGRESYAAELMQEASLSADRITALLGKTAVAATASTDDADGQAMLANIANASAPRLGASDAPAPAAFNAGSFWDGVHAATPGLKRK